MNETLAENVAEFCNELLAKVQALKEEGTMEETTMRFEYGN